METDPLPHLNPGTGTHIIADFLGISTEALWNHVLVEEGIIAAVKYHGFTPLFWKFHKFEGDQSGWSCVVLLEESHLTIHTWPEAGKLNMDCYTCNFSRDNAENTQLLYKEVKEMFSPTHVVSKTIVRV